MIETTKAAARGQSLQDPETGDLYDVTDDGEIPEAPTELADRLSHVIVVAEDSSESDQEGTTLEALQEMHWNAATAAITSGEADDILGKLDAADLRPSVQDALEERQETLNT